MAGPASQLAHWRAHPAQFVREVFGAEPDAWQEKTLEAFPNNPRQAMKACKGPGKTTVMSWLNWNFLATRPHPKMAATSISGDNLRDNFWAEMAKWQGRSELLKSKFTWTKTRIFANEAPETWFLSARTFARDADPSRQADTLAGLHADYIMFTLDESGGTPDSVMVAAEAALASCVEGHILQGGNPSMLSGPLYRACTQERRLWWIVEITGDPDDPDRSPRISVDWAHAQIEKYGRDNPWVLVNVFGKFPPASINALIGPDAVSEAMRRYYREWDIGNAAVILGVDVARFGDDQSVIARRQGIQMYPFKKYRNLDSTQGAAQVSREWDDVKADACFLDGTGGWASGWHDQLISFKKAPISIGFAERAKEPKYFNRRAEMAFTFVDWIKRNGGLPDDPALASALTQTTYTFQGDKLLLEPKDAVKEKLGFSPDEFDAAILTFAEPITPVRAAPRHVTPRAQKPYDPFAEFDALIRRESGMEL